MRKSSETKSSVSFPSTDFVWAHTKQDKYLNEDVSQW